MFLEDIVTTEQYLKSLPFLIDVLAHEIQNSNNAHESIQWVDDTTRDYFKFSSEVIDFIEVLQTMEVIFGLSEGDAQEIFFNHRHSDLILTTVFTKLQLTAQSITVVDLKDASEAEYHYDYIYPQLVAVNDWIGQLM